MQVKHSEIAAVIRIEAVSKTCPVLRILSAIVFLSAVALVACQKDPSKHHPSP
jgi:hypothetical protein